MSNKIIVILLPLLLYSTTLPAESSLQIIPLKARTVEEVVPMIKPFLGPKDTVSGMNNQLIIRTSPARLEEVRKILAQIDKPARSLMIYVRQGRLSDSDNQYIRGSVKAKIGNQAEVQVGEPAAKEGVHLSARSYRTKSDLNITQSIRTIEGQAAFIQAGKVIPVQEQSIVISGGVVMQQSNTQYHQATTGFYVLPRLNQGRVTLQISPHMKRQGKQHGQFDIQQAKTVVSGRLGEWIAIGGSEQQTTVNERGLVRRYSTSNHDEREILLLVEEVP